MHLASPRLPELDVPQFRPFEASTTEPLTQEQRSANFWMALLNARIHDALVLAPLIRAKYRYIPETEVRTIAGKSFVLPAGSIVEHDTEALRLRIISSISGYRSVGIVQSGVIPLNDWPHFVPLCPGRAGRPTRTRKKESIFGTVTGVAGDPETDRLKRAKHAKMAGHESNFGWAMAILKHPSLDPLIPIQYYPVSFAETAARRTVMADYYYNDPNASGVVDVYGADTVTFDRHIFNKAMANWFWYPDNLELTITNQGMAADAFVLSGKLDNRIIGDKSLMKALNFGWSSQITTVTKLVGERIVAAKY